MYIHHLKRSDYGEIHSLAFLSVVKKQTIKFDRILCISTKNALEKCDKMTKM